MHGQPFFLWKRAYCFPDIVSYFIFFTSDNPFGFISAGMIGAQYGQTGAMFILLMSDAVENSSFFTSGFWLIYCKSCGVFFSLSSIVQGSSGSSAFSPLKGHRKLFRPFMTAIFRGDLSFFKMNFFWV